MTLPSSETLHASTVAIDGKAVLITGLSGSGKSDLALRLIDRGAVLVSDDYTIVSRSDDALTACAPSSIKGKMEVRGVGLLPMPVRDNIPIAMIIDLVAPVTRLPEAWEMRVILGVALPVVPLAGFETSAAIKVEHALRTLPR